MSGAQSCACCSARRCRAPSRSRRPASRCARAARRASDGRPSASITSISPLGGPDDLGAVRPDRPEGRPQALAQRSPHPRLQVTARLSPGGEPLVALPVEHGQPGGGVAAGDGAASGTRGDGPVGDASTRWPSLSRASSSSLYSARVPVQPRFQQGSLNQTGELRAAFGPARRRAGEVLAERQRVDPDQRPHGELPKAARLDGGDHRTRPSVRPGWSARSPPQRSPRPMTGPRRGRRRRRDGQDSQDADDTTHGSPFTGRQDLLPMAPSGPRRTGDRHRSSHQTGRT